MSEEQTPDQMPEIDESLKATEPKDPEAKLSDLKALLEKLLEVQTKEYRDELSEIIFHDSNIFLAGKNFKKTVKTNDSNCTLWYYTGKDREAFVMKIGKEEVTIPTTSVSNFKYINSDFYAIPEKPMKNFQVLPNRIAAVPTRSPATQEQFLKAQVAVPNSSNDQLIQPPTGMTPPPVTPQAPPPPVAPVQQFAGGSTVKGKPKSKPAPQMQGE